MLKWITSLCALSVVQLAEGQGHGLCNNSGGFRSTKNEILQSSSIREKAPDLPRKLDDGSALTSQEQKVFINTYGKLANRNAKSIYRSQMSISEITHPTLLTHDSTLAMDHIMSAGIEPQISIHLSCSLQDADTNFNLLTANRQYLSDYRTVIDLTNRQAPNLRLNGAGISQPIRDVILANDLDQLSLQQMGQFLEQTLSPEALQTLPSPRTLSQTFHLLNEAGIGDSALISFNHEIIFPESEGGALPSRRFSIFVQKIDKDLYLLYDPLPNFAGCSKVKSIRLLKQSEGANGLNSQLKQSVESVFTELTDQLKEAEAFIATSQGRARLDLLSKKMETIFGISTGVPWQDILFTDFNIITHSPPPVL